MSAAAFDQFGDEGDHTLVSSLSPLIGRDAEIEAVTGRLRDPSVRLITLLGPGGVGKTRLALAVAQSLRSAFADGVLLVSLVTTTTSDQALAAIAAALGISESTETSLEGAIVETLSDRHQLLLLDNLEQVTEVGPAIARILAKAPDIKALVTSRIALRITGEQRLSVAPLELPATSDAADLARLLANPSVALFLQRAHAVRPDLKFTVANAPVIAEICQRLDGLPLALELAASRLVALSPQALLAQLSDRLRMLGNGPSDAPARQKTMRAAISWSYDLLSPELQAFYRAISIFPGSFSYDLVAAVTPEGSLDPLEGLTALIEASLVQPELGPDDERRYRMLETIRSFGVELLSASNEATRVREAFVQQMLQLADDAVDGLQGPNQQAWLLRFDAEIDNTRAVLRYLLDTRDHHRAQQLGRGLWRWWETRGRHVEATTWLTEALAGSTEPSLIRFQALHALAMIGATQGVNEGPKKLFEEAIAVAEAINNPLAKGRALDSLSSVYLNLGDFQAAREVLEQALAIASEAGDLVLEAGVHFHLGSADFALEDFPAANRNYGHAVRIFKHLNNERYLASAYLNYGVSFDEMGDFEQAQKYAEESYVVASRINLRRTIAMALMNMAVLSESRGAYDTARQQLVEALPIVAEIADHPTVAHVARSLSSIAMKEHDAERAARYLGFAEEVSRKSSSTLFPAQAERAEELRASARAELGEERYAAAHLAGRVMTVSQVIEEASSPFSEPIPEVAPPPPTDPFGLSNREREVLAQLIEGKSDREIAEELFISHRTVMRHVSSILAKLDAPSRTAAATIAIRHGLTDS